MVRKFSQIGLLKDKILSKFKPSFAKNFFRITFNPKRARREFLRENSTSRLEKITSALVEHALDGNKMALKDLIFLSSERTNPSKTKRHIASEGILELSKTRNEVLNALIEATHDSTIGVRYNAFSGLINFAKRGEERVLPVFIAGLRSTIQIEKNLAKRGIEELAKSGNLTAQKILKGNN